MNKTAKITLIKPSTFSNFLNWNPSSEVLFVQLVNVYLTFHDTQVFIYNALRKVINTTNICYKEDKQLRIMQ